MIRAADTALRDFVDAYDLQRGLTKEAARQYRYAAKSMDEWAGRAVAVSELSPDLFNRWLRDLQDEGRLSPATVACRRRHALALWRAAADDRLVEEPPRRLRPAKVPYTPPRAWTVDEVREILATCGKLRRTRKGKMPRAEWWSMAVRIAWDSGLRLSDLLRLKAIDIQPDGRAVVTQSKTSRPVFVTLSPATMEALKASMAAHPRKLICQWDSSRESFRKQFAVIVRRAGVRKGTWKWIRRSSATDVERSCPGAGAAHLGHAHGSDIAAKHYIDPYIVGSSRVAPTPID